jgi:hypothetical protein
VCKLAQPSASKGRYAHFRNWTQRIYHPPNLPDGTFPCIRSVDWDNPVYSFIGLIKSKTNVLGSSRRRLFTTFVALCCELRRVGDPTEVEDVRGRGIECVLVWVLLRQENRRLRLVLNSTWRVFGRRCNFTFDSYVKCDRLRPRGLPNVILEVEDTKDICMRDVQKI